jgi:hypothetical protein
MERQLTLLDPPPSWRLDEATREAGRRGIEAARAALRAARRPTGDEVTAGKRNRSHRSAA